MKNGKTCKVGVKRLNALLCGVLCLFCVLASLASCRSSRNAVEEMHREVHTTVREVNNVDTLQYTATATENHSDTAQIRTDERAVIRIKRDSVGRIVEIDARRSEKVNAEVSRTTGRDSSFYGVKVSSGSEVTDSVATVTKKKTETEKTVRSGRSLECVIGWIMCLVVVLLYGLDYMHRLWERRRGK